MRYHDEVTRARAALVPGPYNSQVPDWPGAGRDRFPASVQPLSSSEDVVQQQRTETRWRVFTVPGAQFRATDRVEWDGGTYEVDGDVEVHKRAGITHHLELVISRVEQG